MPLTVNEAVKKGRKLEKGCDQVNGNRYILNGDRAVILVFDTSNNIAGIATSFPKNLPFNFPMQLQSDYMIEGDDSWTLTAFFSDPNTICLNDTKNIVRFNDKMVIKGDRASLDISRHEASLNKVFTESGCFPTMGRHYWADVTGPVNETTKAENFLPFFMLYNRGHLNGFGFALNANFEKP